MESKRLADDFLTNKGMLLGDKGFHTDKQQVELTPEGSMVFFHFTREDRLDRILNSEHGIYAFRSVACPSLPQEFTDCYHAEGFLEPVPKWLTGNLYFGNLGLEMVREFIGDVLLRVEIPLDFPGVFIADCAHPFECKHYERKGSSPLGLGYQCSTGHEVMQAYIHSYIPAGSYKGGHIAPAVQFLRKEKGVVIPSQYISISEVQPFR